MEKDEERDRKQSSIAVRMALAEAEIVDETQNFLKLNGVSLEAFEVSHGDAYSMSSSFSFSELHG